MINVSISSDKNLIFLRLKSFKFNVPSYTGVSEAKKPIL
jgi:hypothetical protein